MLLTYRNQFVVVENVASITDADSTGCTELCCYHVLCKAGCLSAVFSLTWFMDVLFLVHFWQQVSMLLFDTI